MKKITLSLVLLATLFIQGCETFTQPAPSPATEARFSSIEQGILDGTSLKIEAVDGSFVINSGQFIPPFETPEMWRVMSTELFDQTYFYSPMYQVWARNGRKPTDLFDQALQLGAKRVMVTHPASSKPLYGVLMLNKKYHTAQGASTRAYYIRIPDNYVTAAQGGRVSIVFETSQVYLEDLYTNSNAYTWVLWLSDIPF